MDDPDKLSNLIAFVGFASLAFIGLALFFVHKGWVQMRHGRVYRDQEPRTFWGMIVFTGVVVPTVLVAGAWIEANGGIGRAPAAPPLPGPASAEEAMAEAEAALAGAGAEASAAAAEAGR